MAEHGTVTAYINDRCRCEACAKANRDYQRRYARHHRKFGRLLVPAFHAREHLERLLATGMTMTSIEDLTGISDAALFRILRGETRNCYRDTEDRILGVPLGAIAQGRHLMPAGEARKIVAALGEAGVSERRIASMLGNITPLQVNRHERVTARTYQRLVVLYRLLARELSLPPLEEVLA